MGVSTTNRGNTAVAAPCWSRAIRSNRQAPRNTCSSQGQSPRASADMDLRELRPTLTQFVKRTGTGGIAARGAAIRSMPERSLLAVEEVRRPFPYRPNDTDKSSLDVFSRFLWRSRMRRAGVDTRCTRLFPRLAACSYSSPFTRYAARAVIRTISSSN